MLERFQSRANRGTRLRRGLRTDDRRPVRRLWRSRGDAAAGADVLTRRTCAASRRMASPTCCAPTSAGSGTDSSIRSRNGRSSANARHRDDRRRSRSRLHPGHGRDAAGDRQSARRWRWRRDDAQQRSPRRGRPLLDAGGTAGHGRHLPDGDERPRPADVWRDPAARHQSDLDRGAGRRSEPFLLYDAATSTIAGNKIGLARRVGADMEPGWISEPTGRRSWTSGPSRKARCTSSVRHNLLPLGGTREQGSHKGYGLGLMVEVLTTLLAGAVPSMVEDEAAPGQPPLRGLQHRRFDDVEHFKDTMDRMLQTLTETPPAPGHERVIYPGLPEARNRARPTRQRHSPRTAKSSTGSTARPTSSGSPRMRR